MKLEVHCQNCKEYVLETDTEILEEPLRGHMFNLRPEREWILDFDDTAEDQQLACPMCGWGFHVEQKLLVRKIPEFYPVATRHLSDSVIEGKPKKIVKFFSKYEEKPPPKVPEEKTYVEVEGEKKEKAIKQKADKKLIISKRTKNRLRRQENAS
jgi:hypothetical protein